MLKAIWWNAPAEVGVKRIAGVALALLWALGGSANAAEVPYRTHEQIRLGALALIAQLRTEGAAAALITARAESHLDDPKVQRNLDWAERELPAHLAPLGACQRASLSDAERFATSFYRLHFVLSCAGGERQIMLTYRRKTDGWRLNQFYFD
jgi:hypothetical protein